MAKVINKPKNCVNDSMEGFLCMNHQNLTSIKEHKILLRNDILELKKKGQVTLLCGGGAGHEPAHFGYIGKGMLTAAVSGNVFSSPPTSSILTAIRAIGKNNSGGCLVIVKNYTGDRLNFGLAVNKARSESIKVKMVIVDEDCALSSMDKSAGRRGLCGTVLIQKIAGAMAENGHSLEEILYHVEEVKSNIGTISMSLSSCSLPGSSSTFQMSENHFELGLGIHGEPGVKKMQMMEAKEIVKSMINHMIHEDSVNKFQLTPGTTVVLMINNLGGLSELEINIFVRECLDYFDYKCINVARMFVGRFMTSLEMRGVSLTILLASDNNLALLDQKTNAQAWMKSFRPIFPCTDAIQKSFDLELFSMNKEHCSLSNGSIISCDQGELVRKCILSACSAIMNSKDLLNSLDCFGGDGDCGTTLSSSANAIYEQISCQASEFFRYPHDIFMKISQITEDVMGGTSGALFTIFFVSASSALLSKTEIDLKFLWKKALISGLDAIMQAGGAEPGDRTLVDALHAASTVMQSNEFCISDGLSLIKKIVNAVNEAVENTKSMKAKAGRASYVNQVEVKERDPGAMAILIIFKAIQLIMV